MKTDAHCHPSDLASRFPACEDERRQLGVMCAASATTPEEFEFNEQLAQSEGIPCLLPCFAIHPQMPSASRPFLIDRQLEFPYTLAAQGRLAAIGETGFDLFTAAIRETEKNQDSLFAAHIEIALRYDLPVVLHVRRAMHKIFAHTAELRKCRAVIFHSWPGTAGEGESFLKRGVNAFFSFGAAIMLNHREAMHCCSVFPADRLLTETDAPFQPPRGKAFSRYTDLAEILRAMESLREKPGMEALIEKNFRTAFGVTVSEPVPQAYP